MKFPFDAFILDTAFSVQVVRIVGKHGTEALTTSDGNVVQQFEIFSTHADASKKATAMISSIQNLVFERRSLG